MRARRRAESAGDSCCDGGQDDGPDDRAQWCRPHHGRRGRVNPSTHLDALHRSKNPQTNNPSTPNSRIETARMVRLNENDKGKNDKGDHELFSGRRSSTYGSSKLGLAGICLYPKGIASHSPGLPRIAATLG